ncbi:MAG TPA: MMPL family transporter [Streptosporangiaceae bacterium]|nr:MMPL family transporter [Streptosporangiaceae bacterium]
MSPAPDQFGKMLRRLRWPVVIAWVILVVLLYGAASSLSARTNNDASAYLPSSAQSTRVVVLQQNAAHGTVVDQATVVFTRTRGLTAADLAAATSARSAVARLGGRISQPGPLQRSADGQAAEFTASVTSRTATENSVDISAVRSITRAAGTAANRTGPGLRTYVTGSAAVTAVTAVSSGDTTLLLRALLIVAIILLLVYRSPVLWLLPLLGALGADVLAKAATAGLAGAGLTVSTLSSSILTGLVIGAGSDYALLLIHRYREELRQHERTEEAMAAALRRTLPVLLASAATVTIGMLCLLAARSASLHGLGPVGAVSIVSALLAEVTFLPAILLVLGRAAFWPRVPRPGQPGREDSRVWSAVGRRVSARPAWVTAITVVLLGAACAGLASLYTNGSPTANVKGHDAAVTGQQVLAEHFPSGLTAPLTVLARPGAVRTAAATARATPGVAAVSPSGPLAGYDTLTVDLSVPPYGRQAGPVLRDLRGRLGPDVLVGGDPAVQYDITQAAQRDDAVVIPLVLVVILVVIALLLRAVVASLVLVAATALSFGASFGLVSLLWRYGLGYQGINAQIPLYIFVFLVSLGVDYNIFLSARIREEAAVAGLRPGVRRGLGLTGGVITAAGLIMAGCFGAITLIPTVAVAEVGSAVVVGVLVDTLLVRTVLVPAALLTIGDRIWWPGSGPRRPHPAVSGERLPATVKEGDHR